MCSKLIASHRNVSNLLGEKVGLLCDSLDRWVVETVFSMHSLFFRQKALEFLSKPGRFRIQLLQRFLGFQRRFLFGSFWSGLAPVVQHWLVSAREGGFAAFERCCSP